MCFAPWLERRFGSVGKAVSVRRIYLIDQGSDPHNLIPVHSNGTLPNDSNTATHSNSVMVHSLSLNLALLLFRNYIR